MALDAQAGAAKLVEALHRSARVCWRERNRPETRLDAWLLFCILSEPELDIKVY
jgi:hypothetical protein